MTDFKLYYIEPLKEQVIGRTGKCYNQYRCRSKFNGYVGPIRNSLEEAEQDGKEHQNLLINAYPGLMHLKNLNWIRNSSEVVKNEKPKTNSIKQETQR